MYVFYEAMQNRRIGQAQAEAAGAGAKAKNVGYQVKELEEKLDQMALKCQAMWEILRDATDLSDGDIEQKIHEIDLRDGVADGKMTRTGRKCGARGRTISARHNHCLYCGQPGTGGGEVF